MSDYNVSATLSVNTDRARAPKTSPANGHIEYPQLTTVADVAQKLNLKKQVVKGAVEYHGANPWEAGATNDGFILNATGPAFDRKLNKHYKSFEVARLAGISPSQYEPCVEYANGRPSVAPKSTTQKVPFSWSAATIHSYCDESGGLLFQVGRCGAGDSKNIRQRRPDGNGGWLHQLQDVRRVLYNLPDLLQADAALIVEGEKAADALNQAFQSEGLSGDYVATTAPHGAGKFRPEFAQTLKGKAVYVFPDNDEQGASGASATLRVLADNGIHARRVELPGLPYKGDAADYLASSGNVAELIRLCKSAPVEKKEDPASRIPSPSLINEKGKPEYSARQLVELLYPTWDVENLTSHAAHAQRILDGLGADLCYSPNLGWLIYNGRCWQRDDKHATRTSARVATLAQVVRGESASLYSQAGLLAAAGRESDAKALSAAATSLLRHTKQVESKQFIEGSLHLAAGLLTVETERFDQKPWVIGFQNGTWANGQWREHRREDYLLHLSPVALDFNADRREWLRVLERLTANDADFAQTVQDVSGYILSGASHLRLLPFFYGPKGTGKSTVTELLQTLLGDMSTTIDPKKLQDSAARERLGADLWNRRLAVCSEAGSQRLEAELLKTLSGSDRLAVRFLFREAFTVPPRHVLLMVTNDPPQMDAYDAALKDRVIALPFDHALNNGAPLQLTGGKRIEAVRQDALSPLVQGFAAWAIEGLARVQANQDVHRAACLNRATAQFWADTDPITPFWETIEADELRRGITKTELRKRYETWCDSEGARPLNRSRWAKACAAHNLVTERRTGGTQFWALVTQVTQLDIFSKDTCEDVKMPHGEFENGVSCVTCVTNHADLLADDSIFDESMEVN